MECIRNLFFSVAHTVDGSEIRLTTQHVGNPVNNKIFTIWMFPKIGLPPNHPFVHRVWNPDFHRPFWGSNPPIFGGQPHINWCSPGGERKQNFERNSALLNSGHLQTDVPGRKRTDQW